MGSEGFLGPVRLVLVHLSWSLTINVKSVNEFSTQKIKMPKY